MTKVFLCIALIAMSYIASADVATFGLPLAFDAKDIGAQYPSMTCQTTDGKLYYVDHNDSTLVLQVWDSSNKAQGAAVNITTAVNDIVAKATKVSLALKCLGTNVYLTVAYTNASKTELQNFLLTSSDQPSYAGYMNSTYLVDADDNLMIWSCATTDAKLYYLDNAAIGQPIVQVWDAATQANLAPINITNLTAQVNTFIKSLGDLPTDSEILQCIGNAAYINVGWQDENSAGVQLFVVQESPDNVTTYSLPLQNASGSADAYLLTTSSSQDGKLYYLDTSGGTNLLLQQWDSSSNKAANSVALTDATLQMAKFILSLPQDTQVSGFLLQAVGKDVYVNLAYGGSGVPSGIELFQVQKSAGILSFSFAALFLALVALLF